MATLLPPQTVMKAITLIRQNFKAIVISFSELTHNIFHPSSPNQIAKEIKYMHSLLPIQRA